MRHKVYLYTDKVNDFHAKRNKYVDNYLRFLYLQRQFVPYFFRR